MLIGAPRVVDVKVVPDNEAILRYSITSVTICACKAVSRLRVKTRGKDSGLNDEVKSPARKIPAVLPFCPTVSRVDGTDLALEKQTQSANPSRQYSQVGLPLDELAEPTTRPAPNLRDLRRRGKGAVAVAENVDRNG